MLSSSIVDEIIQNTSTLNSLQVAYFFFDFNDPKKQTVDGMLRSLVFQLTVSAEAVPKALDELYARHNQRGNPTQPNLGEWISLLMQLSQERNACSFVIDALDECQENDSLKVCILDMVNRSPQSVKWLFTCQTSNTICIDLQSADVKAICMESSTVDDDIATYLHTTLEEDSKLLPFSSKAKAMIKDKVQSGARGM